MSRNVTYTLNLNSNVSQILTQADKDAVKFDNTMWNLQKTLSSFGVGLGAHFLIDAAKSWTQGAADFESAMLRIKNASESVKLGIGNQFFIDKEVDRFKLKLQESIDAYGGFLFKIKNAGLSNNEKNKLFDEILTVSKVSGIPMSEMESTIRNTAIMLGEGVLEARHLRGLSYTHPQLVPFIADALGLQDYKKDQFTKLLHVESKGDITDITKEQELSRLISSGKLTKLALPAKIILEAYEKYAESVSGKLPETLTTLQSNINDLDVAWERFKNDFVLDNKYEITNFFGELKDGIHWLKEHEYSIIHIGKNLLTILKLYAEWKIAMFALNTANSVYLAFMQGYQGLASSNVIAVTSQATAYNTLAASLERLNYIQATMAGMPTLAAMSAANAANLSNGGSIAGGVAAGTIAGGFRAAVMPVFVAGMAISVIDELLGKGKIDQKGVSFGDWIKDVVESRLPPGMRDNSNPGAVKKIMSISDQEDAINNVIQHLINKTNPSWDDIQKGNYYQHKLPYKGNELYQELQFLIEKLPNIDVLKSLDKQYHIFNEHGEFDKTNQGLYSLFKSLTEGKIPYLGYDDADDKSDEIKDLTKNTKIPTLNPTTHIRSNSSNYVTIHIDRMTGVETYTVKVDSTGDKLSEEKVAELVGTNLVKILTGVVNDSQLVGKHH